MQSPIGSGTDVHRDHQASIPPGLGDRFGINTTARFALTLWRYHPLMAGLPLYPSLIKVPVRLCSGMTEMDV